MVFSDREVSIHIVHPSQMQGIYPIQELRKCNNIGCRQEWTQYDIA